MQVIPSPRTITPFGGINLIYNALKRMGLSEFIDEKMRSRSVFAHYKYSDIVFALPGNNLSQGSFLSDIDIFKQKITGQHYAPVLFSRHGEICLSGMNTMQSEFG